MRALHRSRRGVCWVFVACMLCAAGAPARGALLPGDIALVGQIDNVLPGSPIGDLFSFVALRQISAGEVIYFTDNGWTGSQYRSGSATDGNGNEQLVRWAAVNAISAGTIIRANTASPNYTWTATGVIPGTVPAEQFSYLDLNQTGDQISAFQASGTNLPLQNWSVNLYTLDDTNGFENATSSQTGNVPSA